MKFKILTLLFLVNFANAGALSSAIDELNKSEISLNKILTQQNKEHKSYIELSKFVLLNKYNQLFLVIKRNNLILNQHQIRATND